MKWTHKSHSFIGMHFRKLILICAQIQANKEQQKRANEVKFAIILTTGVEDNFSVLNWNLP